MPTKHRRNPPPPPPRRRSTQASPRVATDLARVRRIAGQLDERERSFDPSKRGSWRGSSRDLVVNPRSFEVRMVHKISPRDTDRKTIALPDSAFSDKTALAAALRKEGLLNSGQRLREMRVEGDKVVAFPEGRNIWHSFIIDMDSAGDYRRNGDVDERDIPEHLRKAEMRAEPEENGQDVGYSQGGYSGTKPGWYQVEYATGSDYSGGSVNESNYRVLTQMLAEAHPADEQPVVWAATSGGHGTYGIVVRYGDLDEEIREAIDGLEDYPLLSEEDHGELEIDQQNEAWDNWAKGDFVKECAKDLGVDPYELNERAEAAGIDWWRIFNIAQQKANVYWEDQQGAGQFIRVGEVADAATDFISGTKLPSYVDADMVEEYEKLGVIVAALQEESEE